MEMQIRPVGISGALCVLGNTIDDATGDRVAALARAAREARLPGFVEAVPGYATLLVRFNPLATDFEAVCSALRALDIGSVSADHTTRRVVKIPVCYGGEYGPDLADVARHAGLTEDEVVRLHSGREYRVYMLGFLPGFAYLGGLDARLAMPRLDTPRVRIPAGSVGIGGQQTGVYPMESPGGWRLIGRTPLRLFDPDEPPLYRAGDGIRFSPISPEEYREREGSSWR